MAQDLRHDICLRLMIIDNQDDLVHDASLSAHPSHRNGRTRCSRRSLCKRLPDPFQRSPLPDRAAALPYAPYGSRGGQRPEACELPALNPSAMNRPIDA